MYDNTIYDQAGFFAHILRELGAPVINVEVDEEQIRDRVNEALRMYYNFHMDGSENNVVVHQFTQDDINNRYIIMPDNVISVIEAYYTNTNRLHNSYNNLTVQVYFNDLIRNAFFSGANNYVLSYSYLETLKNVFKSPMVCTYNVHSNKLKVTLDWSKVSVGDYIGISCYMANTDMTEVYNDYWLKKYAAALVKKQWGTNITKHGNVRLPGGEVLNGEQILAAANDEIVRLEERLRTEFSYMPMPFMG